jgi:hypothetical protein
MATGVAGFIGSHLDERLVELLREVESLECAPALSWGRVNEP